MYTYVYANDNDTYVRGVYDDVHSFLLTNGVASGFRVIGSQYVYSGGIALDTIIMFYGTQNIYSGGVASNTTLSNGHQYLSGGIARETLIHAGGYQRIYNGSIAYDTVVSGNQANQEVHFNGAAYNVAVYLSGRQSIYSGGVGSTTNIYAGGSQTVATGGSAYDTTIYSGGSQCISSGGIASNVEQNIGGRITTFVYEYDIKTYVSGIHDGKDSFLLENGVANGFHLYSGASQTVYMGGSANNTNVYSGGMQYVATHGVTYNTTVSRVGAQIVSNGGKASDTILLSGGRQYISSGGRVFNLIQHSGGILQFYMYGHDETTYIKGTHNGVDSFLLSSGVASGFHLYSAATQYVYSSGAAVGTTIYSGGSQYVNSKGSANSTTIYFGGSQTVVSAGVANNTIIFSGGRQILSSGARAKNTTINYGGSQTLLTSASAYNSIVKSGGRLNLNANANTVILGGVTDVGGIISAYSTVDLDGGDFIYNLTERTAADSAIVNNQANLTNIGSLTISITSSQAEGTYKLAGGAAAFDSGITLLIDGISAGSLTLDTPLTIDRKIYVLSKSSSILNLVVREDAVEWPEGWSNAPAFVRALPQNGIVGADNLVSGNVFAARTQTGSSYTNVRFDYATQPTASFFALISGGTITNFRGSDHENYLYMTDGSVTTLYAGVGTSATNVIQIDNGTIGTIYGGGSNGAMYADTAIAGGIFTNVYGGGAKGLTETVAMNISGGTFNRLRAGAESGASVGNVVANITGGTITGQIAGGGLGNVTGNVALNISLSESAPTGAYIYGGSVGGNVSGDIELSITGGAYQGIIVVGSRVSGNKASVTVGGLIELTLTGETSHISNPLAIASKVDTAWIFAGQAMAGGKFTGADTAISASGGAIVKYLVGGAAADGANSTASVADVAISLNGANVTGGVWGAGYAYNGGNASAQNVTITINAGDSEYGTSISGDINTGGIVLGATGSVSYNSGAVIFTGSGNYLSFTKTVDGSGATTSSTLIFDDFTDGFSATIANFKRVVFTGDTSVNIRNAYTACTELVFDLAARTTESAFVTSDDSFRFDAGAEKYIGLVIDSNATGELVTELMGVSDLASLEGVKIGLLSSYDSETFYASFNIGELYQGDGFELMVDYDSGANSLFSWFSAT